MFRVYNVENSATKPCYNLQPNTDGHCWQQRYLLTVVLMLLACLTMTCKMFNISAKISYHILYISEPCVLILRHCNNNNNVQTYYGAVGHNVRGIFVIAVELTLYVTLTH